MLDRLNAKLDRVKIRQKGNRLYLRATLPAKDGSGEWKQYDVRTGCPTSDDGYKAAFGKAQRLESDLIFERFTWDDWTHNDKSVPNQRNIEQWIDAFTEAYWQQREKTDSRAKTFHRDYLSHYRALPLDEPITVKALEKILLQWPPETRSRKASFGALTRLAKFADLTLPPNWERLRGNYKPSGDRLIPSDQQIIATWEQLTGAWQWAYGIMACYGIRNHELLHLNFDDYPAVRIGKKTKTGSRITYPLHPDWAEKFDCSNIRLPNITATDNREIGSAVGKAFRRLNVGHTPYALRDGYAIRAASLGISPAIAAKWLGHSLSVHYGHYLKYIEKGDFDAVWEGLK